MRQCERRPPARARRERVRARAQYSQPGADLLELRGHSVVRHRDRHHGQAQHGPTRRRGLRARLSAQRCRSQPSQLCARPCLRQGAYQLVHSELTLCKQHFHTNALRTNPNLFVVFVIFVSISSDSKTRLSCATIIHGTRTTSAKCSFEHSSPALISISSSKSITTQRAISRSTASSCAPTHTNAPSKSTSAF